MNNDTLAPGDVIRLKEFYKPGTPSAQLMHNVESGEMMLGLEYAHWDGFRYGIVAHVEDHGRVVFVYVYDTTSYSLYLDGRRYPVRVQFSADELELVQKAGDFGSLVQNKKV